MSNTETLKLVTLIGDLLEQHACAYCGRKGNGREECEGCGAAPARECIRCGWRSRGWCDSPAHLRCGFAERGAAVVEANRPREGANV